MMRTLIARLMLFSLGLAIGASAGAQACYESSIVSPSPFMGNDGEVFKLADGSIWEVSSEYEYMYEYSPDVIVCPGKSKIIVGETQLNVRPLSHAREKSKQQQQRQTPKGRNDSTVNNGSTASEKFQPPARSEGPDLIESQIDGEFSGWEGETIFKLTNGQIWQQSSYAYTYSYSYMPKVLIFKADGAYQMKVNGVDGRISVMRLH